MSEFLTFYNFSYSVPWEKDQEFGPVVWPYFNLFYVKKGKFFLTFLDKEEQKMNEGDFVLIYPHTRYRGVCLTKDAVSAVHRFELENAVELPSPWNLLQSQEKGFAYFSQPPAHLGEIVDISMNISVELKTELNLTKRTSLLAYLLAELYSQERHRKVFIKASQREQFVKLEKWLQENLSMVTDLDEMAEFCGMSKSHFRNTFTEYSGYSPKKYFIRLKMQEAASLLRYSELGVKEIAVKVGYNSIFSFSKAFKSFTDMSPRQFRMRGRE